MISEAQWLGLLHVTESNRPHEWPMIGWTARRRVESDRVIFGGPTYPGVITKRSQFSAFNGVVGTLDEIYSRVRDSKRANGERYYPEEQIALAEACAAWLLGIPSEYAPIPPKAFFYFSPVSMKPAGALPKWDWNRLRRYAWEGVDPYRFIGAYER